MIKASEAREQSQEIRFKGVDPEKQWAGIQESIKSAVNHGIGFIRWHEGEVHPDNKTKLLELGYEVKSAGLNSSSNPHDAIYW